MSDMAATALPVVRAKASGQGSTRFLLAGAILLGLLVLIALAAPLIAPHDPETVEVHRVLGPPDLQHPFGSDVLGRDVLSRVVYGLRASLLVSISAVAASLVLAVPLGLLAG
jgi:peptide/nickel transport system permease protein